MDALAVLIRGHALPQPLLHAGRDSGGDAYSDSASGVVLARARRDPRIRRAISRCGSHTPTPLVWRALSISAWHELYLRAPTNIPIGDLANSRGFQLVRIRASGSLLPIRIFSLRGPVAHLLYNPPVPSLLPIPTMRATRLAYDQDLPKSLTPQRKHRKLLKDGSSEVWPEDVERVFVQGLREYWESPWATYSRGRSRWRNQFLVDYLQKNGVDRSKKQVASHIQVLRNMWKGEPGRSSPPLSLRRSPRPEYHLVAGGEELSLETALLPNIKAEDSPETHLLTPAGLFDDLSPASDRSAASRSLSSGSPTSLPELSLHSTRHHRADDDSRPVRSVSASDARRLSPLSSYWTSGPATQSCPNTLYTATLHYSPDSHQPTLPDSPLVFAESSLFAAEPCPTGLASLSLWAEGMASFVLPVDALASPTQPLAQPSPAVVLRIKLHLPPIDVPAFPALHGVHASFTCTIRPCAAVRCATSVLVRGQCTSRESNLCTLLSAESAAHDQLQSATLLLPDSPLTRSRWLDAGKSFSAPSSRHHLMFSTCHHSLADVHRPKNHCK